jgi:fimbrial chaperone protein
MAFPDFFRPMVMNLLKHTLLLAVTMCISIMLPVHSRAGNFKVAPVHILFDANEKTSFVRITNMGDEKATIQIHVLRWRQNENGEDEYEETGDIVIFPMIAVVGKDKERIIRLGYQGKKALSVEGTYRLIVEELPVKKPGEKVLRFALRISLPVFISPIKEITDRSIEKVEIRDGNLLVRVKNGGNAHITVSKIRAKGVDDSGSEFFSREKAGLHILAGASKTYSIELTEEECLNTKSVKVGVEIKSQVMESAVDVDKAKCLHKQRASESKKRADHK